MYPSFTSLSQRKRKRNELLDKAKRRVAQANAKREMYSDAAWSSDVGKIIDVNRNSKVDAQTQAGEPDINKPPVMKDDDTRESETNTEPTTEQPTTEQPTSEEPVVEEESIYDQTKEEDEQDQLNAKSWIINLFIRNPNWSALKIHPIKFDKKDDTERYLGKKAIVYKVETNRISKSKKIDWVTTARFIRNIYSDGESNSIDEVSLMQMNDFDAPTVDAPTEEPTVEEPTVEQSQSSQNIPDSSQRQFDTEDQVESRKYIK
jgi:hypothetical protein